MPAIEPGMIVITRTADGQELRRMAVTGVEEEGHDFPVVWVTTKEEWDAAGGNGQHPEAWPWPAVDVWPADEVPV